MGQKNPLLKIIYENGDDLLNKVQSFLDAGADPNESTEYFETPLRVASNNGRFDVVKLLFAYGANEDHLNWTELFHAVAYGTPGEVETMLGETHDLNARDTWERTPFLLSIQTGDVDKVKLLLDAGADRNDRGRCGKPPLEYAIQSDDDQMLGWLIRQGFDFEAYNDFGYTPLMQAAEDGATKCVAALIDAGADIFRKDRAQFSGKTAIAQAANAEIARLLVAAGDDLNDIDNELRAKLLGIGAQEIPNVTKQEYLAQKHRVFGKVNPELCTHKFWYEMVRCNAGAWNARDHFGDAGNMDDPAVWCYERFGKSITQLGNGEYIEIAGEHEDHYDPDFCIYNEVFHHHGAGAFEIYMYPKEVFPPTDFHTATLVDEHIYIIGNLGYYGDRKYGTTPVYRLDIKTFRIDEVVTKGDNPRWIYNHKAYFDGKSAIRVKGGEVLNSHSGEETHYLNKHDYELCLETLVWVRRDPLPMTREPEFFPAEYKKFPYSDGMLVGFEEKGKWRLTKILKVHRVDVSKGQAIMIAGEEVISSVDDFLFVVAYAASDEYESLEALERAVSEKTCTLNIERSPCRTVGFSGDYRFLGFEDVSKEELREFERWKKDFAKGSKGIP